MTLRRKERYRAIMDRQSMLSEAALAESRKPVTRESRGEWRSNPVNVVADQVKVWSQGRTAADKPVEVVTTDRARQMVADGGAYVIGAGDIGLCSESRQAS